jgi:hypothetical protein
MEKSYLCILSRALARVVSRFLKCRSWKQGLSDIIWDALFPVSLLRLCVPFGFWVLFGLHRGPSRPICRDIFNSTHWGWLQMQFGVGLDWNLDLLLKVVEVRTESGTLIRQGVGLDASDVLHFPSRTKLFQKIPE